MQQQNNTVRIESGRVHKHTINLARRVVKTMTSDKTPDEIRYKLREALQGLFACTNIGKSKSLSNVENVAAVMGCTGLYYLGEEYTEAREARTKLCRAMEEYARVARPWLYRLGVSESPAARRAHRSVKMLPPPASPVMRVAT
jgi:hypothetical protein